MILQHGGEFRRLEGCVVSIHMSNHAEHVAMVEMPYTGHKRLLVHISNIGDLPCCSGELDEDVAAALGLLQYVGDLTNPGSPAVFLFLELNHPTKS